MGRRRDGDGKSKKNPNKGSAGGSEDGNDSNNGMKKPLIAKLRAGVKLQVANRNQNDGEYKKKSSVKLLC